MVQRQFPRPRDLAPLVRFKKWELSAKTRRLCSALTIDDPRDIARRHTPRAAFDYTEIAAEAEISLARARPAFEDIEFQPTILRDVSAVETGWEVLGRRVELPSGLAPVGFTRMMQTEGEIAGASAAAAAGIPFALSTMGTTSIEDVARAGGPGGRNWFQLYMWKDRQRSMALVDRAAKAGFDTLLVTVDVPVAGARLRDTRNGMSIPPSLTPTTVIDAIGRPAWWINFLTTEPLAFASLARWSGTVAELLDTMFDPTVDFDDLRWIKEQWPGKVVVKGVQTLADARRLTDLGVDGTTLSHHGGRLDRAPVPFHLLPEVAREVGDHTEVHLDTGIIRRRHRRLYRARRPVHHDRPRLHVRPHGWRARGRGPYHRDPLGQIARTMRLLGVGSLEELEPGHVRQVQRLTPRPNEIDRFPDVTTRQRSHA